MGGDGRWQVHGWCGPQGRGGREKAVGNWSGAVALKLESASGALVKTGGGASPPEFLTH